MSFPCTLLWKFGSDYPSGEDDVEQTEPLPAWEGHSPGTCRKTPGPSPTTPQEAFQTLRPSLVCLNLHSNFCFKDKFWPGMALLFVRSFLRSQSNIQKLALPIMQHKLVPETGEDATHHQYLECTVRGATHLNLTLTS